MVSVVQPLNLGDLDIVKKLRTCSMDTYLLLRHCIFIGYPLFGTSRHELIHTAKKSQFPKNCHLFFSTRNLLLCNLKISPTKILKLPNTSLTETTESFEQILLDHPPIFLLKKTKTIETTHLQGRPKHQS